jgi:hypothetical protein
MVSSSAIEIELLNRVFWLSFNAEQSSALVDRTLPLLAFDELRALPQET